MKFEYSEALNNDIAHKFHIGERHVEKIHKLFLSIRNDKKFGFEQQYLSHLIRSLECIVRDRLENPFFRISLQKLPEDDPVLGVGVAQYSRGRCFTVYYHPSMDPKELRVCLAHELGHLVVATLLSKEENDMQNKEDIQNFNCEPVSTVFGIFAILDKNYFYRHLAKEYCHKSSDAVVDSFVQMNNREKGILHSS